MRDILSGAAFLIFSLFFLWASFDIFDPGFDPLGPIFMPRLALTPIALISVLLIVKGTLSLRSDQAVTAAAPPAAPSGGTGARWKQVLILVLLAAYIFVLNTRAIPFEFLTPAFILAAGLSLVPWTRGALIPLVIVAIAIPPGIAFVFKRFLFVNLP